MSCISPREPEPSWCMVRSVRRSPKWKLSSCILVLSWLWKDGVLLHLLRFSSKVLVETWRYVSFGLHVTVTLSSLRGQCIVIRVSVGLKPSLSYMSLATFCCSALSLTTRCTCLALGFIFSRVLRRLCATPLPL